MTVSVVIQPSASFLTVEGAAQSEQLVFHKGVHRVEDQAPHSRGVDVYRDNMRALISALEEHLPGWPNSWTRQEVRSEPGGAWPQSFLIQCPP